MLFNNEHTTKSVAPAVDTDALHLYVLGCVLVLQQISQYWTWLATVAILQKKEQKGHWQSIFKVATMPATLLAQLRLLASFSQDSKSFTFKICPSCLQAWAALSALLLHQS